MTDREIIAKALHPEMRCLNGKQPKLKSIRYQFLHTQKNKTSVFWMFNDDGCECVYQ